MLFVVWFEVKGMNGCLIVSAPLDDDKAVGLSTDEPGEVSTNPKPAGPPWRAVIGDRPHRLKGVGSLARGMIAHLL